MQPWHASPPKDFQLRHYRALGVRHIIPIFVFMATKLKKSTVPIRAEEKKEVRSEKHKMAVKKNTRNFKKDREEKIDLKKLARDERTWKIIGTLSLLISIFLLIAFISYFFTWKEDQDQVLNEPGFLWGNENNEHVSNLLGRLGAYLSHFFIYKGFGIASLLFCTFFFVSGINLLLNRKVFSIWRNLKYVTVGLLIVSVCCAFLFSSAAFPFGGRVGIMISNWLINFLGTIGTAALLVVVVISYLIWQFNPVIKMPGKKTYTDSASDDESYENHYPHDESSAHKSEGNMLVLGKNESAGNGIELIDGEDDFPLVIQSPVEKEMVNDILHQQDLVENDDLDHLNVKKTIREQISPGDDIELEIKTAEDASVKEEADKGYSDLPPYEPTLDLRDYKYPTLDLLETHGSEKIVQDPGELEANKNQIITTLKNYDITIQKIMATVGPTVTLYEIVPAAGVRISRIKNLEDDIALSLAALGIRIIAPIPGKGTVGIEVPNHKKSVVSMKTLLTSEKFQRNNYSLPIAIGKKIDNELFIVDLASMPHLLMAGATGQGKSVGLNAILVSLLYKKHPSELKLVLIDPKKVELSLYLKIEKHFLAKLPGEEEAIITVTKKVVHTLNALCIEMDTRYDLLKEAGARNIKEYNEKFIRRRLNPQKGHQFLPFIVLVIDEFADLIMTAGKEIEMPIARLAQLARAVGIHLIIATQRPSVNIITGTIKANFPSRIAFKVSSKIDSRTILDAGGAEQLIGKGDMLISHNGEITRLQCPFVDTPEVEKVVESISKQRGYPQPFLLPEYVDEKDQEGKDFDSSDKDPLFEDAARLIVQNQVGSTSLIQRRMKLGYNRAGRLMDQLEAAGVVGPNLGSKAREVLIKTEMDLQEYLQSLS
jgi:S-DNA-T family DNA segregation ATPase FtsK/SpoIIIE